MAKTDDYRFLQIKDAMACLNQRVNFIGVIAEYGIPKKSKGTDWFFSLKVIDESYQSPGIAVNIFAETMDKLPHFKSAGDIIVLSHVMMKHHGGEIYALFNKKVASFALFEGKHWKDLNPYQVSAKFHPRDQDKKIIAAMREGLTGFQLGTGSKECLYLREIREKDHIDLFCKILHKCQIKDDEWMLFVWDGTDAPPVSIKEKLEDEAENPLPLQLELVPLPRDIYCTFPGIGTVLRVTINQDNEKMDIDLINVGNWVRFMNITCEVQAGLWHGVVMPFTRIRYTLEESLLVQRQRSYDERISTNWDRTPLFAFPGPSRTTETDHGHVSFVTLMEILTCAKVTAKFRCIVRVLELYPLRAEDFRSPSGVYRIRLTLEDPTARIHAYVYAEDGEKFFEGFPSVDVLTRKLNELLGVSESNALRNPPWVKCCLKSYYLDKSDPWGTRNFRIFDTKLVR